MSMSAATEQIMFNEMTRVRKGGKYSPHESNYTRLFGTPERAANVILALQICPCVKDECVFCPAHDVCFEHYKDGRTVYEMAEWLSGDA